MSHLFTFRMTPALEEMLSRIQTRRRSRPLYRKTLPIAEQKMADMLAKNGRVNYGTDDDGYRIYWGKP